MDCWNGYRLTKIGEALDYRPLCAYLIHPFTTRAVSKQSFRLPFVLPIHRACY